MRMPCGGVAIRDPDSGICAMRCQKCFAVVGSVGMPDSCKKIMDQSKCADCGGQGGRLDDLCATCEGEGYVNG